MDDPLQVIIIIIIIKKTINITLAWDLLIRAFLGRGEDCPTHCDN